jgi:hypothetical protein
MCEQILRFPLGRMMTDKARNASYAEIKECRFLEQIKLSGSAQPASHIAGHEMLQNKSALCSISAS